MLRERNIEALEDGGEEKSVAEVLVRRVPDNQQVNEAGHRAVSGCVLDNYVRSALTSKVEMSRVICNIL